MCNLKPLNRNFVSCSKHDPDAIDAAQIEGRWQVESIRYEGTLDDGTAISAEPEHCDIFWTGDIIEFKGGSIYMGGRFTLSNDLWIIRHEHRQCFDIEYKYFYCDFEFVLKRVS